MPSSGRKFGCTSKMTLEKRHGAVIYSTLYVDELWRTFRGHMENIQRLYGEHSEVIWRTFGGHMENIRRSYGEHLEVIWRTFGGHLDSQEIRG